MTYNRFVRFLLLAGLLCATANAECVIPTSTFGYPQIARLAVVQGSVQISFTVDADGKATVNRVTGSSMLAAFTKSAIAAVKLGPGCAGDRQISVEYRLRDKKSSEREVEVTATGPESYRVTVNRPIPLFD